MNRIRKHIAIIVTLSAALLALAMFGTALAAGSPVAAEGKTGLFGTVTEKAATTLTVESKDGQKVVLAVTAETKIRIPGVENPTLDSVEVGNRVAVLASVQGETWTALQVMVVPAQPTTVHQTVTVVEVQGNTVVAEDADGNKITIELPKEASPDLQGQVITIVVDRSGSKVADKVKAKAHVAVGQIVERLKAYVAETEKAAKAEADARKREELEKSVEKLTGLLEQHMEQHLDRFSEVIAKAPPQAQDALKRAMENYRKGYEKALDDINKATATAKERLNTRRATGTVASVDAAAGTISIQTSNGGKLDLKADQDTKVTIGAERATLADVVVGDSVYVEFNPQTMIAKRIQVQVESKAAGVIKAIDASGQLSLALEDGTTLTLALTNETKITVNGKQATAADLKVGMNARVIYNLRTLQTQLVAASSLSEAEGTLKVINVEQKTFTIITKDGVEMTFKVTSETRISAGGLVIAIIGLKKDTHTHVVYDSASMEAKLVVVKLEREKPDVRRVAGLVSAVDVGAGTFSVQTPAGGAITLKVDEKTKIEVDGKEAKLADLKAGMHVGASYNFETSVAIEVKASSRPAETAHVLVTGTIQAVDVNAKTVTIETARGLTATLKVTDKTKIRLNGKEASLPDLAKDMKVLAQYYVQSLEAIRIEAFSKLPVPRELGAKPSPTPKP